MEKVYVEFTGEQPDRAHRADAGFDLYAAEDVYVSVKGVTTVRTGTNLGIPEGYVGLLFSRSGLSTKFGVSLANSVGVIDAGYTGEVQLKMETKTGYQVRAGDKVGQIVILSLPNVLMIEVEELSETERGSNGFGSTGV
jgi:dUTP pyrophosphatase